MRKNIILSLLLLSVFSFSFSGCVYLLVGGIGAIGGYVISPDTVEGITENEFALVWDSAEEVLSIMGVITSSNKESGLIHANVLGTEVLVSLVPITELTLKIKVKARKLRLPRISTAQDIFVKIMSNINE